MIGCNMCGYDKVVSHEKPCLSCRKCNFDICSDCFRTPYDVCVGPIWGNYEAAMKVYDFLHQNPAFARDN